MAALPRREYPQWARLSRWFPSGFVQDRMGSFDIQIADIHERRQMTLSRQFQTHGRCLLVGRGRPLFARGTYCQGNAAGVPW